MFFHHSTPWICALQRSSKTPTVELLSTLLVCRIIGSMESDESWQSLRSWRQRCNSSSVMPRVTVRQRQYSTCIQRLKLSKLSSRESAKISKVYWIILNYCFLLKSCRGHTADQRLIGTRLATYQRTHDSAKDMANHAARLAQATNVYKCGQNMSLLHFFTSPPLIALSQNTSGNNQRANSEYNPPQTQNMENQ